MRQFHVWQWNEELFCCDKSLCHVPVDIFGIITFIPLIDELVSPYNMCAVFYVLSKHDRHISTIWCEVRPVRERLDRCTEYKSQPLYKSHTHSTQTSRLKNLTLAVGNKIRNWTGHFRKGDFTRFLRLLSIFRHFSFWDKLDKREQYKWTGWVGHSCLRTTHMDFEMDGTYPATCYSVDKSEDVLWAHVRIVRPTRTLIFWLHTWLDSEESKTVKIRLYG